MRKVYLLFLIICAFIFLLGCESKYERNGVDGGRLIKGKDNLLYYNNEDKPYTGYFYKEQGDINAVGFVKNGKQSRKFTVWFEHGGKMHESYYEEGLLHGKAITWYSSGEIKFIKYYKRGVLVKTEK